MTIVSLFCEIDDFLIVYEKYKSAHQLPASQCPEKRGRSRTLHPSEVMTILILFHQSRYQTLKDYSGLTQYPFSKQVILAVSVENQHTVHF